MENPIAKMNPMRIRAVSMIASVKGVWGIVQKSLGVIR